MRRFRVAETSMHPTLAPGDVLLTVPDDRPGADSIVVFRHPDGRDMWLVKRVTASADGEAWVESDNPRVTMADSRTFGWVPTAEMHRAVLRWRRPLGIRRV